MPKCPLVICFWYCSFRFDEIEKKEKEQNEKLSEDLNNDIKELQERLVTETRQADWETMRKSLYYTMHKDL